MQTDRSRLNPVRRRMVLVLTLLTGIATACGPSCAGELVAVGEQTYEVETGCWLWSDGTFDPFGMQGGGFKVCLSPITEERTRTVYECREVLA